MKKYNSYSTYQPSSVEWLGEIPLHWEIIRLKHICWRAANYGANESSESYLEEGVRFLRTTDIDDFGNLSSDGAVFLEDSKVADYKLDDGDILISRSGTIGRSFLYSKDKHGECAFAGYLVRFSLREKQLPKFIFYFTKSRAFLDYLGISIIQSTIGNVNGQKYANMSLSIPPLTEQKYIVSFLDRETTRIDTLITKKRELINLLEKKRNAVIAHAVTKGLNSNASMTDSKIEWLGKIPEHWKITRLKFISPQITVGIVVTPAKYYVDTGVPCLRSLNVKQGKLMYADIVFISSESNELHRKSMIFEGDLVVVRTGQPGATAVVDKRFHGANCIDLIIVRQSPYFNSHYLSYLANSDFAQTQFELGSGGAIQQHFNVGTAANLQVLAPPIVEQQEIVSFLDKKLSQMNNLINKVQKSINLLQQQRSALITAAVTGKIDVREEVKRGTA
ncbi:restriction endonuclease subunit S [Microcoleus vaginatus GB2-A3]|uniref:restriction endonuclease subunit S n=1 Tax=Microcoleus vaginatus TaxID=119532 RepID=UPI0032A90AFC